MTRLDGRIERRAGHGREDGDDDRTAPCRSAIVLESSATRLITAASFSAMTPKPTTAMTRISVPSASAASRRVRSIGTPPPRLLEQQSVVLIGRSRSARRKWY